jgi:hypothetical protein
VLKGSIEQVRRRPLNAAWPAAQRERELRYRAF